MRLTPRFPKNHWEVMEIHEFSFIFHKNLLISKKKLFLMISQNFLANLGVDLIHPPQLRACLAGPRRAHAARWSPGP